MAIRVHRCYLASVYNTKTEGSLVFTRLPFGYSGITTNTEGAFFLPIGFYFYIFGFRGYIGFRGCNKKKRLRYRSKYRGSYFIGYGFFSLIDYTTPQKMLFCIFKIYGSTCCWTWTTNILFLLTSRISMNTFFNDYVL